MKRAISTSLALAVCLATAALAQVQLVPRNPEGTATFVTTYSLDQTLNILGMDTKTQAEIESKNTYTTGKPAADGTVRIQERTDAMTATFSLPGGLTAMYDSAKPETAKNDSPVLQGILDSIHVTIGKAFTRVIDKDNRLVALEGTEKILEQATPAAQAELRSQYSVEYQKRAWEQDVKRLPDGPVKVGDKWKRTEVMPVGGGQLLTYTVFYDYQGTVGKDGKSYDKLGVFHDSVVYSVEEGSPLPFKVAASNLKPETTTGTVLFDRERGEIVENSQSSTITGDIMLDAGGMMIPAQLKLSISMSSKKK